MSRMRDAMEMLLRGEIPPPPVARRLGLALTACAPGEAVVELPVDEGHTNPMGTVQGGILAAIADAAMGWAYMTLLEEGETYTTLEMKINFLKPVWQGRLSARARPEDRPYRRPRRVRHPRRGRQVRRIRREHLHEAMAVTALEIHHRALVLDGRSFGEAGAHEKVIGVIRFAADPAHRLHRVITDLALAPRNAEGRVESWADFYLLSPAYPARGNRRLLLDVPNRGRKVALGMFNSTPRAADPSTPEDFGNGFQATLKVVAARHLLVEDVEAIVERAGQLWGLFQAGIEEPGP